MDILKPEMIDSGKLKDVQMAMGKDLRVAAKTLRGKDVWFVAAANVPLADKTRISLFVVSKLEAQAKAWQLKLKGKKPQVLTAGTCKLQTKDGTHVDIALENVKGDRKATLKVAQLAFKADTAVGVADALAEAKEDAKTSADAARNSAAVLSGFGVGGGAAAVAKEIGVSQEVLDMVLRQNAAELKAEVERQLKQLRQEANQ